MIDYDAIELDGAWDAGHAYSPEDGEPEVTLDAQAWIEAYLGNPEDWHEEYGPDFLPEVAFARWSAGWLRVARKIWRARAGA